MAITFAPEPGSISPPLDLLPKDVIPNAREVYNAQNPPDPLAEFEKFEPAFEDAGGAKKIDLNAREKLGGFKDPLAEFQKADPIPGFEKADDLDVKSVEQLDADRDNFRPAEYFTNNPDVANSPKRLEKLLEVVRRRDDEGLIAKRVAEAAIKNTPTTLADIGGGIKRFGERAVEVTAQPVANVLGSVITGDIFDDKKREAFFNEAKRNITKAVAEGSAGTESAGVTLADLSRQGAQKLDSPAVSREESKYLQQLATKAGRRDPNLPITESGGKTDQQLLAQLADDAAFQKNAADILTGQGEAAKNFGLDKETLAKEGIELDENAIRQLSLVDPVTMVATGGAFKLVGIGGKILGTARTIEGAQKIADKLAKVAKISAGKGIQGVGKATTFVGERFQGAGRSAALITGIGAASQGAGAIESLAIGAATKAAGPIIRKIGKVTEHAGKAIAGEVPVSANLQRVLDYAKPVIGGVENVSRGALQGLAAGAPFAVAAQDDETAGALLGAGAALGAAGGAVAGGFRVVKRGVSRRYFGENRPVLEDVPSPGYGDAALDTLHEAQMQKLSAQDASEVNNFREILRPLGRKIYSVDRSTFRQKVSETLPDATPEQLDVYENHSAFFNSKDTVYLNSDATGLQHDAGHLFDSLLTPEKRTELRQAVEDAFGQPAIEEFKATYERRVGNRISDTAAKDEFIAEQFAALFNNVPITEMAAPKSLLTKFVDTLAEGAEYLGIDLAAGATTPVLGAPVSVGIRKLFQNAAGDVTRASIEARTAAPTNVTPFPGGPEPTPGPVAPAPTTPPTNVTPLPGIPSRNIRVGPENVAAFKQSASPDVRAAADARARETGVDYARTEAKKDDGSPNSRIIESISDSMESGRPVVQIEHLGITSASTPEGPPLGRTPRRGEQSAGYAALEAAQLDVRQNAPPEIVNQHSKNFVPVRWTDQGGTPTLIAMSLDKVIANMMKVAADPKAKDLVPYPIENGKFTAEGWRQVVADAQAYAENQSNGRRGDGGRLEVPEAGLSIPAENPAYTPQPLTPERANFQNLVQGLAPPLTARSQKGVTPGNVKGQILAEANLRPTETPASITPARASKQAFIEFPGRTVQEVNPLRNEMERRGVKTRELIEVTERIRAKDIVSSVARPDVNYAAPVTDIIRGGFQPAPTEFRQKNLGGRTVEEFSDYILKSSPEEWKAATDNMTGGLTGGAWNLGLGLKDAADVGVLKAFQGKLTDAMRAAIKSGELDSATSLATKGQFFREAHEAATGTGSAGAAFAKNMMGFSVAKPPFPVAESGAKFLPAEQLEVGTAESRPPELRVLPAAPGGRPPTEPPSLRPPPIAAGFQPAEELQTDEAAQMRVLPAAPGGRPPTGETGVRPPPVASGVARDDEAAGFQPKSDEKIQDLAKTYAANAGIEYTPRGGYAEIKPDLSKRLADFYEAAKSNPNDPAVKSSYDALIRETEEQGKSILAAGYKIEPWTGAGEPYKNSAAAISDVRDNKHLFFRQTEGAFAGASDNPMLAESSLVPGQSVNDVFRWVHDFFGHSKEGYQFGPRGEFNAWRAHSEMYSPEAQGALAAETLAQNSWVNFGPQAKDLPLAQRPFAEQKNVVVPKGLIDEAAGFQPRIGRDAQGRPLKKNGDIDYARWQAEGLAARRSREAEPIEEATPRGRVSKDAGPITGWILPDKNFVPLDTNFHEQYLAENAPSLNEKFNTAFSNVASVDDRLAALNAGFVRLRNQNGQLRVEVNAGKFRSVKSKLLNILQDREGQIDGLTVSLLNDQGVEVDSTSAARLHELSGPEKFDAISEAVDSLRVGRFSPADLRVEESAGDGGVKRFSFFQGDNLVGTARTMGSTLGDIDVIPASRRQGIGEEIIRLLKEKEGVKSGIPVTEASKALFEKTGLADSSRFSPAGEATESARLFAENKISEARRKFPEAAPLQYARDEDGNIVVGSDGKAKRIELHYDFIDSPVAKLAAKGLKGAEREKAATAAVGNLLAEYYGTAIKNPEIKAGEKWYELARTRLNTLLGDDSKLFAELLGATSARTAVELNFKFALEAYNQFKSGAFDDLLLKYREGKSNWESGNLKDFVKATKETEPTRARYLDWWIDKHDLNVTQSNGKKFGMNSRAVLKVLDGSWASEVKGPKTPNFTGNLSGQTFEATIDVWAARAIERLVNDGSKTRWRLLPDNETGVNDADFYFGQAAFRHAAEKLGIKPDALQAVLWFAEKDYWEKKGWSRGIGAEKSDFNTLLQRTQRTPEGRLEIAPEPTAQIGLDFGADLRNVSKKKR